MNRFWLSRLPWALALFASAGFTALGVWQLGRAEEKNALINAFEAQAQRPVIALAELDPQTSAARYRRVEATGRYVAGHQWLLDNQLRQGRAGYRVLTPLALAGRPEWILVDRGWVEQPGASRTEVPAIPAPPGEQRVRGRLSQPPNPGLRLGRLPDTFAWPAVVPWIDYAVVERALGHPLLRAVILLDEQAAGGFVREWSVSVATLGPERHRGYAVQWFALALAVVVTAVVLGRRRRRPAREVKT